MQGTSAQPADREQAGREQQADQGREELVRPQSVTKQRAGNPEVGGKAGEEGAEHGAWLRGAGE